MIEINKNLLFFEAVGFSMWPFLKSGQKVIVKRIPISDLKCGDIILYRVGNQFICHRLVKKLKQGNQYLLCSRGDFSLSLPESVTEEMFLGKVSGVIKNSKIISIDGPGQHIINRIILMIAPLIVLLVKIVKIILRKR